MAKFRQQVEALLADANNEFGQCYLLCKCLPEEFRYPEDPGLELPATAPLPKEDTDDKKGDETKDEPMEQTTQGSEEQKHAIGHT